MVSTQIDGITRTPKGAWPLEYNTIVLSYGMYHFVIVVQKYAFRTLTEALFDFNKFIYMQCIECCMLSANRQSCLSCLWRK